MTSIQALNCNNQVSFGKKTRAVQPTKTEDKNTKLKNGAKVLAGLAAIGAATWGVITLAKRGKAINAVKDTVYYGNNANRILANKKQVETANKIVEEMKAVNNRTSAMVHGRKAKTYANMNWDATPVSRASVLEEMAKKA
jgi:allantoicase